MGVCRVVMMSVCMVVTVGFYMVVTADICTTVTSANLHPAPNNTPFLLLLTPEALW